MVTWLLLTNLLEDLSHLLHLLFCYLSRHFSVIDLRWSVRERWDCREEKSTESSTGPWNDRTEDLRGTQSSSASHKPPFSPRNVSRLPQNVCAFNQRRDLHPLSSGQSSHCSAPQISDPSQLFCLLAYGEVTFPLQAEQKPFPIFCQAKKTLKVVPLIPADPHPPLLIISTVLFSFSLELFSFSKHVSRP